MNTKSELDLTEVEVIEADEKPAAVTMSLGDLDMVAGGGTIASFY